MNFIDKLYPKRKEIPKTCSGKVCWFFEKSAHNAKHFILRNKTHIDIIFILIYLVEQALLIYFTYTEKYSFKAISSLFILTLLSTMAVERALMELRYTALNEIINRLTNKNLELENKVKKFIINLKKETINKITNKNLK